MQVMTGTGFLSALPWLITGPPAAVQLHSGRSLVALTAWKRCAPILAGTAKGTTAMKGMVFVELLNMAEEVAGEEAVDAVLDGCELSTGGAYNAVGNYPCGELMTIVEALSERLGAPVEELQRRFGRWMHGRFVQGYPAFFVGKRDVLTMLEAIEGEVHVEVRKLYPGVELPTFATERLSARALRMTYRSPRPLVAFCHGLIEASIDHFGHPAEVAVEDRSTAGMSLATFTIRLAA